MQIRWQNDEEDASRVAPALQDLAGKRVPVIHALQNFFLEEPYPSALVQKAIGRFVAARQLPGYPMTVSPWDRKEDR